MPYDSLDSLPDAVKSALSKHGQEIWLAAFNSAFEQYKDEEKAFATAWAAAKKDNKENSNSFRENVRSLNRELKNQFVRGGDGSLLVKDVPLLAEGEWTDSSVQTPLFYPQSILKKCANNWVIRSIWARHSGGMPRSITDKVGEIENERFDESAKAILGDLRFHCRTQVSKDCSELVEGGFINAVSVEHGGTEKFNREASRYEAEELEFYGLAMVDRGACETCVIRRKSSIDESQIHAELSSERTPSRNGEASEGGKKNMDEEMVNKFAEIEARLAALEEQLKPESEGEGEPSQDEPKEMAKLELTIKELGEKVKALEMVPNKKTVIENVADEKFVFINE